MRCTRCGQEGAPAVSVVVVPKAKVGEPSPRLVAVPLCGSCAAVELSAVLDGLGPTVAAEWVERLGRQQGFGGEA